jgi:hypothetical protein
MEDVNKYLETYNNQPVSKFTKRLWWCAGADEQILMQCPMADRVRYAGIGGIVLCTGLLAAVSGGYAFYTIFAPKGDAVNDNPLVWGWVLLALFFALVWGAIILNMDRFIVSSTGKGDGKDSISGKELVQALPRIIIAFILGIAISTPLEVRILKTEIDAELQKKQDKYLIELNQNTDTQKEMEMKAKKTDLAKVENEQTNIESTFEKRRIEIQDARKRLEDEIAGRIGSGKAGEGPAAKTQRENLNKQEVELEAKIASKAPEIQGLKDRQKRLMKEIDVIDKSRDDEYKKNQQMAYQLDGLLERIHISHELSTWIPIIIFLVLFSIEAGPIFFKMMMNKGAYEYLVENNKKRIEAQHGIVFSESVVETQNGSKDAEKVSFLEIEHELNVKKMQLAEQDKLASQVVSKWSENTGKKIDENPEDFYKES